MVNVASCGRGAAFTPVAAHQWSCPCPEEEALDRRSVPNGRSGYAGLSLGRPESAARPQIACGICYPFQPPPLLLLPVTSGILSPLGLMDSVVLARGASVGLPFVWFGKVFLLVLPLLPVRPIGGGVGLVLRRVARPATGRTTRHIERPIWHEQRATHGAIPSARWALSRPIPALLVHVPAEAASPDNPARLRVPVKQRIGHVERMALSAMASLFPRAPLLGGPLSRTVRFLMLPSNGAR